MVLAGVGIGVAIGPLAIHARFSQPAERLAIVSAMLLFVSVPFSRRLRESVNDSYVVPVVRRYHWPGSVCCSPQCQSPWLSPRRSGIRRRIRRARSNPWVDRW